MHKFDLQLFASSTIVRINGVINNVEVGDSFTVDGATYTILSVADDSVTAAVSGTPATNLGNSINISDSKSITGITNSSSATSSISTKYNYTLDIGGNSITVTVANNSIESVTDSSSNAISPTNSTYSINGIDFTLNLNNGIPSATYDSTNSVTATLSSSVYSFTVDSKAVEVTVANGSITAVKIDNTSQTLSANGIYSIGNYNFNLSYSNGLSAQVSQTISPTVSSSTAFSIGDQTVTVSNGTLSTTTATIDGNSANLTYDSANDQIIATYDVSTNPTVTTVRTYSVTINNNTVTVTVDSLNNITVNGNTKSSGSMWNLSGGNLVLILNASNGQLSSARYTIAGGSGGNASRDLISTSYNFTLDGNTQSIASTETSKNITVNDKSYTITNNNGTITVTEHVSQTYNPSATIYTFQVNNQDVSVAIDSSGNLTYNGSSVTDNKITVNGIEVNLTVSNNAITAVSYLGSSSNVTNITQTDTYAVTIDGQNIDCVFDSNNQFTTTVNGVSYTVTKTDTGADITHTVTDAGTESSRNYIIGIGDSTYAINCTFDGSGNLSSISSTDSNLTINGTTITVGNYTINLSGTKDNLTSSATLSTVNDIESSNLFTLSGISSTTGITVNNGVVTINSDNLNGENVTISGSGYTLALGSGISAPNTTDAHFDGFVYKSSSSTAGYTLSSDSTSITYSAAVSETNLFTLSGVSSTDGITVSDSNVVTINSTNLNGETVSISGTGYTLALGTGINAPVTTNAHFDGFVYKSSSSTAGYTLSSDSTSIIYSAAVSETNLFTLSGISSTDGITVSDSGVVTINSGNLNGETVSISGTGYTLALGTGISAPVTTDAHFDGFTYKSSSSTAGYILSSDSTSIIYSAAVSETDLFTLSGVSSTTGITVSNGVVTINSDNLNGENVTISGDGYTLALSTNVEGYQVSSDGRSIIYSTGSTEGSDSGSTEGSDSGSTVDGSTGSSGSIIYGSISSIDDYLAPAVEDSVVGTGSVEGSTVAISWTNLGLAIETNEVRGEEVDINQPNTVTINDDGEMTAATESESDAVISVDANTNSATLVMHESNRSYNLTFHGGAIVANWNARLSNGNDQLHIGNIKGGHFDGGHGKDYFHVTKNLQENISLTGGASNDDLDSGNNFYAESNSVSSTSDQSKVTITDVNFNATDILLIDAGIENLTADFFGDSKFYNYATAEDADRWNICRDSSRCFRYGCEHRNESFNVEDGRQIECNG